MAKLTLEDIAGGYGLVATYNANNDLIEAALENTLSRDGTSPNTMSANLDMNSNRVVNVTDPSGNQDAATKAYVDDSLSNLIGGITDFSVGANYTITGAWTFTGNQNFKGSVVITDSGVSGLDHTLVEDSGHLSLTNDTGFSSFVKLNGYGSLQLADGASLRLNSSDNLNAMLLNHDGVGAFRLTNLAGSEDFEFTSTIPNVNVDCNLVIEDGHEIRVYDDGEDDYGILLHTGAEFEIRTTGAGAGQVPISLNPGGVQPVVIETGNLMVAEASGSASDLAGHGQHWVKDDTPNIPKFTDDAGTDFNVGIFETGSFTGTLTGCTTSPTATFQYIKEKLQGGFYRVTIWSEAALTGTSNSTACSITGLPAALTPTTLTGRDLTEGRDDGNGVPLLALLAASGTTISLAVESAGSFSSLGFTNTGNKGILAGVQFQFIID